MGNRRKSRYKRLEQTVRNRPGSGDAFNARNELNRFAEENELERMNNQLARLQAQNKEK